MLSNADPANIGDIGVGDMGNVLSNHDTQQGINSMIDQQTVNAQNTASDNQLIGLEDSTSDTTGPHDTTGGDDHGDQDIESEESEPSESTQSESSQSIQPSSSSSETPSLKPGQTKY